MFARTRWAEAAYKLAGFEQNTLSLFPFPLTLAMPQMHSGICPPMPAWLLLPLSPQWADSVRCAGRWLTRKTWDYFCCHHTLFKNVSALTKGNRWMPADVSGETGTLSSSVCVKAHKWESFSSQNRFHCTLQLQLSPMSWTLPKYIFFSTVNFPHWNSSQNV